MYIVTGGAGMIGSALIARLNAKGINNIVIVDELGSDNRWKNIRGLAFEDYLHKDAFLESIIAGVFGGADITAIVHLGADTSSVERDADYLMENNYGYTKALADWCLANNVRFIYASSAATYGNSIDGCKDDHSSLRNLRPQSVFGYTKHLMDLWALKNEVLDQLVGLKFFNVYGPNEYHKEDNRSMVLKAYESLRVSKPVELFASNVPNIADGEDKRDFVYVKDCCEVISWFLDNPKVNGIFNCGTAQARSFNEVANIVAENLGAKARTEYVEIPPLVVEQYQSYTQADISKLRQAGCEVKFSSLEEGVNDYVSNYLDRGYKHIEAKSSEYADESNKGDVPEASS